MSWDMDAVTELTPNLFVCGLRPITLVTRYNFDKLRTLGVTLVVNATKDLTRWDLSAPTENPNIHVVQIPVHDIETENIYPYFKV